MSKSNLQARAAPAAMKTIALPHGDLAYFESGDPTAPLVVLQHGFPDYPKTFFPLMQHLDSNGFRSVAPFLRGYFPSTQAGPFDENRLGDDLADLVTALSPDRPAALIGHDWGAIATYAAVSRWPRLFRRAVTLAVPHLAAFLRNVRKTSSQQRRSAYIAFLMLPFVPERIVPRNDFAFVDALWRRWSPGYEPAPEYRRELKQCLHESMPAPLGHYRALVSTTRAIVAKGERNPRIDVPLLHLHGSRDGCIAFEAGIGQERYFSTEFSSECLPGLGHFLHLEDPDRIATKILPFLRA